MTRVLEGHKFNFCEYDYVGCEIFNAKTSGKAEDKFGISEISFGNYKSGLFKKWAKEKKKLQLKPKGKRGAGQAHFKRVMCYAHDPKWIYITWSLSNLDQIKKKNQEHTKNQRGSAESNREEEKKIPSFLVIQKSCSSHICEVLKALFNGV